MQAIWLYNISVFVYCIWNKDDFSIYRVFFIEKVNSKALIFINNIIILINIRNIILKCILLDKSINPITLLNTFYFENIFCKLFSDFRFWKANSFIKFNKNNKNSFTLNKKEIFIFEIDRYLYIQVFDILLIWSILFIIPVFVFINIKLIKIWY